MDSVTGLDSHYRLTCTMFWESPCLVGLLLEFPILGLRLLVKGDHTLVMDASMPKHSAWHREAAWDIFVILLTKWRNRASSTIEWVKWHKNNNADLNTFWAQCSSILGSIQALLEILNITNLKGYILLIGELIIEETEAHTDKFTCSVSPTQTPSCCFLFAKSCLWLL